MKFIRKISKLLTITFGFGSLISFLPISSISSTKNVGKTSTSEDKDNELLENAFQKLNSFFSGKTILSDKTKTEIFKMGNSETKKFTAKKLGIHEPFLGKNITARYEFEMFSSGKIWIWKIKKIILKIKGKDVPKTRITKPITSYFISVEDFFAKIESRLEKNDKVKKFPIPNSNSGGIWHSQWITKIPDKHKNLTPDEAVESIKTFSKLKEYSDIDFTNIKGIENLKISAVPFSLYFDNLPPTEDPDEYEKRYKYLGVKLIKVIIEEKKPVFGIKIEIIISHLKDPFNKRADEAAKKVYKEIKQILKLQDDTEKNFEILKNKKNILAKNTNYHYKNNFNLIKEYIGKDLEKFFKRDEMSDVSMKKELDESKTIIKVVIEILAWHKYSIENSKKLEKYKTIKFNLVGFKNPNVQKEEDKILEKEIEKILQDISEKETIKNKGDFPEVVGKIDNAQKFKEYTGMDLTKIPNIDSVNFVSGINSRDRSTIEVQIEFAGSSKKIDFKITGFMNKGKQKRQIDSLFKKIQSILGSEKTKIEIIDDKKDEKISDVIINSATKLKEYTGKDLTKLPNINILHFRCYSIKDNTLGLIIELKKYFPNINKQSFEYIISGFKNQEQINNEAIALSRAIQNNAGYSGTNLPVVESQKGQSVEIVHNSINNVQKFKDFTGKDLSGIPNIDWVTFSSMKKPNNTIEVTINIPHEINITIKYIISGFKNQEQINDEANALIQAIKDVVGDSDTDLPVVESQKGQSVEIVHNSINNVQKFKDFTGKDLSGIPNINRATFSSMKKPNNTIEVTISISHAKPIKSIKYIISGFKNQEQINDEANALIQAIKDVVGDSDTDLPVVESQKGESVEIVHNSINNVQKFKDFTGVDLSGINNINRATFSSMKKTNNTIEVTISISHAKPIKSIKYIISGFKNQEQINDEANALIQAIKDVVGDSDTDLPVVESQKGQSVEIVHNSINNVQKFKDFTGKDLSGINNINRATFSSMKKPNNTIEVTINIPHEINITIKYIISGFKTQEQINDEANALIQAIKDVVGDSDTDLPVVESQKGESVEIVHNSINNVQKFKDFTGKDLSGIPNIDWATFSSMKKTNNTIEVTISISHAKPIKSIKYIISGFKNQEQINDEANALIQAIKDVVGDSDTDLPVVESQKGESVEIVHNSINNVQKFKDFTGKDLSGINNINRATFSSMKKTNNTIEVTISISHAKPIKSIKYIISGFKNQEQINDEANALIQAIKDVVGDSDTDLPVVESQKGQSVEIVHNSINNVQKFKDFTGKDLSGINNINRATFSSMKKPNNTIEVTISISHAKPIKSIKYIISGFKTQAQLDAQNIALKKVKSLTIDDFTRIYDANTKKQLASHISNIDSSKKTEIVNMIKSKITNVVAQALIKDTLITFDDTTTKGTLKIKINLEPLGGISKKVIPIIGFKTQESQTSLKKSSSLSKWSIVGIVLGVFGVLTTAILLMIKFFKSKKNKS